MRRGRRALRWGAAVTVVWIAGVLSVSAAPGFGSWEARTRTGLARQEVSFVNVGDKLYLAGGRRRAHQVYDPASNTWSNVAQLPAALDHIQAVSVNGLIYYIGGLAGWPRPAVGTVYIYDPPTDSFTQGAPMPRPRGAGGITVYEGKIYVAGGLSDGRAVAWFDVYDPESDTWRSLPNMPRVRDHFQAEVVDGRLYAIGGRQGTANALIQANDAFDFASGSWITGLRQLPSERGGYASAVIDGNVVIIGGEGGGSTHNEVEAYDPLQDAWRTLAPMPTARHGIQAAVCDGGVYVAAGGTTQGGGSPTDVHEVFFDDGPTSCRPPLAIARDRFERTLSQGWGTAPTGGPWSITNGSAADFSVDGSRGSIRLPARSGTRMAVLRSTAARDLDAVLEVGFDDGTAAGGRSVLLVLRRQTKGAHDRVGLLVNGSGKVVLVGQTSAGSAIFSPVITSLSFAPGDTFALRVQISGSRPTRLRAKVWELGSTQPSGWLVDTVTASGPQRAGALGVRASNTSTTAGRAVVDDLWATQSP